MVIEWEAMPSNSIGKPFDQPIWMVPGNAKARRRWRRRNVPNSQRVRLGHFGESLGPSLTGAAFKDQYPGRP